MPLCGRLPRQPATARSHGRNSPNFARHLAERGTLLAALTEGTGKSIVDVWRSDLAATPGLFKRQGAALVSGVDASQEKSAYAPDRGAQPLAISYDVHDAAAADLMAYPTFGSSPTKTA